MEKFVSVEYGKRKMYAVLGMGSGAIILLISSFFTQQDNAKLFALLSLLSQVCMVFLDVSTHALMVKQLDSIAYTTIILCFAQTTGIIIGTMLILKLTSL